MDRECCQWSRSREFQYIACTYVAPTILQSLHVRSSRDGNIRGSGTPGPGTAVRYVTSGKLG